MTPLVRQSLAAFRGLSAALRESSAALRESSGGFYGLSTDFYEPSADLYGSSAEGNGSSVALKKAVFRPNLSAVALAEVETHFWAYLATEDTESTEGIATKAQRNENSHCEAEGRGNLTFVIPYLIRNPNTFNLAKNALSGFSGEKNFANANFNLHN